MSRELTAIQESIKHWVRMRDTPVVRGQDCSESPDGEHCALCHFSGEDTHLGDCEKCPIKVYTGEEDCHQTPWWGANNTFKLVHADPTPDNRINWEHNAQLMIDFLVELEGVYK